MRGQKYVWKWAKAPEFKLPGREEIDYLTLKAEYCISIQSLTTYNTGLCFRILIFRRRTRYS
jgi:hypothetical protein